MTITAQEFFDITFKFNTAEDTMVYQLLGAAGVMDPGTGKGWPCDDITFDWYDESFEFKNVLVGWSVPTDFDDAVRAMGFDRYWLCFADGTEKFQGLRSQPRRHDVVASLTQENTETC